MSPATSRLEMLQGLMVACNDSGVRWALLRGRANLGVGHDEDLLVAREHQSAFEELVREAGGVVSPGRLHVSHRSYRIGRPLSDALVLDVVTGLTYNRQLQIPSGLEAGCLDRRIRDGWLYEFEPTDQFWAVLLHCLFDKRCVTERRARELTETLPQLTRPSEGEMFTAQLLPPGWCPQRLVDCVEGREWASLQSLADKLTPVPKASPLVRRHPVIGVDAFAGRLHAHLWVAAGLGATARAATVLESARLRTAVMDVRRRPGVLSLVLAVSDADRQAVETVLRREGYRHGAGAWTRLARAGLERVRLVSPAQSTMSPMALGAVMNASLPLAGRQHYRWAVGVTSSDATSSPGRQR